MNLLLESALKGSVILAIALVAMFLLKRQSAAFRHWLLACALLVAASQPAMSLLLPNWALPALTQTSEVITEFEVVGLAVGDNRGASDSQPAITATGLDVRHWLMMAWIAGVLMNVAVLIAGMGRLAWLHATAQDATDVLLEEEASVRAKLDLHQAVHISLSAHPAMLVAWGIVRPTIVMPADAASWTADRLRVVIAHEMAHVKRRDWAVQLGAELLRSVYWFNPLFWVACARLRQESEYACDDVVLALGIERTSYASHLVDLARGFSAHGRTWLPAPAVARPSTLQRRVRAMLNPRLNRRPVAASARAAIAAALLCVALPVAGLAMQSAAIGGTVRDSSGRVLPNATIRLSPVDSDAVTQITTDAGGRFSFPGLAAGEYLLTARSMGFSPLRQNVRVSARETLDLPLTLQVGTLRETITVTRGTGATVRNNDRPQAAITMPAPPPCTPSSTGGQIVPPMKLRDVKPRYDARLADVKGTMILDARIGIDGKVGNIEVFSGVHPDLEDAAIAAVSQWEFSPTYLNCEPIEVRMLVSVTFAGAR